MGISQGPAVMVIFPGEWHQVPLCNDHVVCREGAIFVVAIDYYCSMCNEVVVGSGQKWSTSACFLRGYLTGG